MPRIQRPLWVTEQLEVALFEGLAHRIRAIRSIARQRRARTQTDKRWVWYESGLMTLAPIVAIVGGVGGYVAMLGDMSKAVIGVAMVMTFVGIVTRVVGESCQDYDSLARGRADAADRDEQFCENRRYGLSAQRQRRALRIPTA